MLYDQYLHGLFAAINIPIYRFKATVTRQHNDGQEEKIFTPDAVLLVLTPHKQNQDQHNNHIRNAFNFAKNVNLYIGDILEITSADSYGAVRLPDKSLVVLGPIREPQILTKELPSSNERANIWGMKIRSANLWLQMVGQIVVHDEMPSEDENELYQEAEAYIPNNLKKIAQEVKLKAPHNQYRYEIAILDAIAQGDIAKVDRAFKIPKQGKFGVLGPTPLRSMKNHVHNLNALSSRTAIKAGILPEKAYALSDKFFMAAEECLTVEQCLELRTLVAKSFATMVREYKDSITSTPPPLVNNAISLISRSLFIKCTVKYLATNLNVSPEHLEYSFKKSMGIKLSQYIMQEKIKQAKELLQYTNEPVKDIANLLCFANKSHFSSKFKAITGLTPSQFRTTTTLSAYSQAKQSPKAQSYILELQAIVWAWAWACSAQASASLRQLAPASAMRQHALSFTAVALLKKK